MKKYLTVSILLTVLMGSIYGQRPAEFKAQNTYVPLNMNAIQNSLNTANEVCSRNYKILKTIGSNLNTIDNNTQYKPYHYQPIRKMVDDIRAEINYIYDNYDCVKMSRPIDNLIEKYNSTLEEYRLAESDLNTMLSLFDTYKTRPQETIRTLKSIKFNSPSKSILLTRCYLLIGEYNNSYIAYKTIPLASVAEQHKATHYRMGWDKCYNSQNYYNALEYINNAISINPSNAYNLLLKGLTLSRLNRYSEAKETYNRVLKIDPSYSMAYNNIGWNYFETNNLDSAYTYVNKALILDPQNSTAWDSMADIEFSRKNYTKSKSAAHKAIEINTSISNSRLILSRIYMNEGNKELACKYAREAMNLKDDRAPDMVLEFCK